MTITERETIRMCGLLFVYSFVVQWVGWYSTKCWTTKLPIHYVTIDIYGSCASYMVMIIWMRPRPCQQLAHKFKILPKQWGRWHRQTHTHTQVVEQYFFFQFLLQISCLVLKMLRCFEPVWWRWSPMAQCYTRESLFGSCMSSRS